MKISNLWKFILCAMGFMFIMALLNPGKNPASNNTVGTKLATDAANVVRGDGK